jgi:hypothetical protein
VEKSGETVSSEESIGCHGNVYRVPERDEGYKEKKDNTYRGWSVAATSAAALASPRRASIGAFRVALGKLSSESSSDDGAVLGTIPYL